MCGGTRQGGHLKPKQGKFPRKHAGGRCQSTLGPQFWYGDGRPGAYAVSYTEAVSFVLLGWCAADVCLCLCLCVWCIL